jgi:hypothetical protein
LLSINRLRILASLSGLAICISPAHSQYDSGNDAPNKNTPVQPSEVAPVTSNPLDDGTGETRIPRPSIDSGVGGGQVQPTIGDTSKEPTPDANAATSSQKDEAPPSQSRFINGGVEQNETITMPGSAKTEKKMALPKLTLEIPKLDKLPPVPKFLQAGATFNDKEAALLPDNVWYRIPDFAAGNWECSEKTITSSVNLLTGKGNFDVKTEEFISELHFGFQQDKKGAFWQFQVDPFMGHSIGPNDVVHYSYVQLIEPISCSENRFVRRCVLTKVEVNDSQLVLSSQQSELIQSLTPLGQDKIREDTLARTFDAMGRPKWQSTSTVVYSMTRPYTAINRKDGKDMREMFRQYLESHNSTNLVPNFD